MCKEMTELELKDTNGCGSSHWALQFFRVPRWVSEGFFRCCNRHDRRYQNSEDKDFADDELYDCMMYSAMHSSGTWWKVYVVEIVYIAITSKISNIAYAKYKKG
jgi:hypothetical protein